MDVDDEMNDVLRSLNSPNFIPCGYCYFPMDMPGKQLNLQCTACSKWYHMRCLGMKSRLYANTSRPWVCDACIHLDLDKYFACHEKGDITLPPFNCPREPLMTFENVKFSPITINMLELLLSFEKELFPKDVAPENILIYNLDKLFENGEKHELLPSEEKESTQKHLVSEIAKAAQMSQPGLAENMVPHQFHRMCPECRKNNRLPSDDKVSQIPKPNSHGTSRLKTTTKSCEQSDKSSYMKELDALLDSVAGEILDNLYQSSICMDNDKILRRIWSRVVSHLHVELFDSKTEHYRINSFCDLLFKCDQERFEDFATELMDYLQIISCHLEVLLNEIVSLDVRLKMLIRMAQQVCCQI